LEFIFNRKLTFWQHITFYANKALLTVKCIKLLGNSSRGLISTQKYLLYRSCVLPIILYSFQLWLYNKAPLVYSFKELRKIQQKAAIWILGAFCTSPTIGIEAITDLILTHLHLQKLSSRFQLRTQSLPTNYIIKSILESRHLDNNSIYHLSLKNLTPK